MNILKLTAVPLVLVLAACSTTPPKPTVVVQEVYIPVPTTVQVKPPPRPKLAIEDLKQKDRGKPDVVIKHLTATIAQLMGYSEQLEAIISTVSADIAKQQGSPANKDEVKK